MSNDTVNCGPTLAPRQPLQGPTTETILQAPPDGVTVRMYRQGLGDCFLLAFPTAQADQSYYVLIDCGVLQGAPNGAANLNAVAQDIKAATGGQIHLLVATHRHADHISGFSLARDVFASMTIHNLWFGWPEKPDDPVARQLWAKSGQALAALTHAVNAQPAALEQVKNVLDFVGDLGAAAGGNPMDPVRALLKRDAAPEYQHPGAGPLLLPAVPDLAPVGAVRLYVLGPPTKLDALAQMNPASGSNETYLAAGGLNAQTAFMMGALDPDAMDEDERALYELSHPFDGTLQIPADEARHMAFFRQYYGFDEGMPPAGEMSPQVQAPTASRHAGEGRKPSAVSAVPAAAAWRRIDDDWLGSAEELALQLDNSINNTSLVLAIEFVKSQKVMLFAADAQVGNWLSWHDLPGWTLPDGHNVTVPDLLGRTVLYKVGHHGSHNATAAALADASPWGLELMCDPELVAMLPVDTEFANCVKHWPMPWPNMMDHLNPRTSRRIMRIDTGIPQTNPGALAASAWAAFTGQVQVTDLYVQYTLVDS
jgi:hypothetical protein